MSLMQRISKYAYLCLMSLGALVSPYSESIRR